MINPSWVESLLHHCGWNSTGIIHSCGRRSGRKGKQNLQVGTFRDFGSWVLSRKEPCLEGSGKVMFVAVMHFPF
jgi:hypothetical protein